MATIALGVAGAAVGGWSYAAIGSAIGAGLGSLIDSQLIALITEEDIPAEYGTVSAQGAEGGAAIWRAHGEQARVVGNVLWVGRHKQVPRSNRIGKRAEQTSVTNYVDACIGLSRHRSEWFDKVQRLFVDGKLLYDARQPLSRDVIVSDGSNQRPNGPDLPFPRLIIIPTADRPWGDLSGYRYEHRMMDEPRVDLLDVDSIEQTSVGSGQFHYQLTINAGHGVPVGERALVATFVDGGLRPFRQWSFARAVSASRLRPVGFTASQFAQWQQGASVQVGISMGIRYAAESCFFGMAASTAPLELWYYDIPGAPIQWSTLYPGLPYVQTSDVPFLSRYVNDVYQAGGFGTWGSARNNPTRWFGDLAQNLDARPDTISRHIGGALLYGRCELRQTRQEFNLNMLEGGTTQVDFPYLTARAGGGLGLTDQEVSPLLEQSIGTQIVPGFRDMVVVPMEEINVSTTGNRLGNFDGIVECYDTLLWQVLRNVCEFHGITGSITSAGLDITCRGYAYAGQRTGLAALAPLMTAYDCVAQERGDGVHWTAYDAPTSFDVGENIWLPDDDGVTLRVGDMDKGTRIRSLTLSYRSADEDLIIKQAVDIDPRISGGIDQQIRLDVALSDDEARAVVARIARRGRALRWKCSGTLPRWYANLQAGDVIRTTLESEDIAFRITSAELDVNWNVALQGMTEAR